MIRLINNITVLMLLFLAGLSAASAQNGTPKKVLILNSYHPGFSWSDEEESGVIKTLRKKLTSVDTPMEVFVEYLDSKRYPAKSDLLWMKKILMDKYRGRKIDLIIALDDSAVDMLTKFHAEFFPNVPAVFAGIASFDKFALRGRKKITGVLEKQDIRNTIETALSLHPRTREILNISDSTNTGISAQKELKAIASAFTERVKIRYLPTCTHEDARAAVAALSADSIILINSYTTDSNNQILSMINSTRLIASAAKVPVYGVYQDRLGGGIVGGYLLDGHEQGRIAAEIGLRVLAGEKPEVIPVKKTGASIPMFDYKQMKRFDIPLSELPKGSIVIDKPESVFTTHRDFAVTIIIILIILIIAVLFLVLFIVRLSQAKASIRRKTDELDRIFRLSPDLLCIASLDGSLIRLNLAWESTLGYHPDELEGKMFYDLVHPDDIDASHKAVAELAAGKNIIDFTNRILCKDGSYRWIEWRTRPYLGSLVYAVGRDITGRKQAEEALRFTQYAIDNASDQAFWLTEDGSFVYVNNAACRALGYSREELLKLSVTDIDAALDPRNIPRVWQDSREKGYVTVETFHRAKDGHVYPAEIRANFVVFDGKEYNCAFVTDITERKRMEESLRESEGFRRALLQAIPDLIWLKNTDGVFLACNSMFERFFGAQEENIVGKTDYDFVEKDLADFFREHDREAIAAAKATSNEEWITFADDGHRALLETIKTPMYDDQGKLVGVLGVGRDITERRIANDEKIRLQNQLQQAQKMETLGRLAGGVAHDFNNMLGVIMGYAELSLSETDPSQKLHDALLQIMKAAKHSAEITGQLLGFGRRQRISPKVIDINDTVEGMTKMLARLIGEDVNLEWSPGETVWPVRIDPVQVNQILVNLCVNARDAVSDAGKITIETGHSEFDESYCSRHFKFVPGEYVLLSVSDNGNGMDKETLDNIFEPFFTTKDSGKGTGLGLSMIYGIVKQNNGFINVYSEPEQGTTFKIYFPRYRESTEFVQEEQAEHISRGEREMILLVEDEQAILEMTTMMLKSLGYRVMPTRSPAKAISLFEEYSGKIDLLMTDVIMPEMNGRDLAEKIHSIDPELKLLYMSGYTSNVIAIHGVLNEGVSFLQKPFSKKELASRVREALGKDAI